MECIVVAETLTQARALQYAVENLGEEWRCQLATGAAQAARQAEGAQVLLLCRCKAAEALLTSLPTLSLLAPPWVLGLGMDAPDGELFCVEGLPQLLQARRREGRLPVLAAEHQAQAAEMAAALLRTLGTPRRLRAWAFLPEMAALTVVHPPLLNDLQHGLYPLIGAKYGMTAAGVERSLRLCVESTWSHGSLAALERFFGSSVDPERGKPTNREFLCRVQERLTLTLRRLQR